MEHFSVEINLRSGTGLELVQGADGYVGKGRRMDCMKGREAQQNNYLPCSLASCYKRKKGHIFSG